MPYYQQWQDSIGTNLKGLVIKHQVVQVSLVLPDYDVLYDILYHDHLVSDVFVTIYIT